MGQSVPLAYILYSQIVVLMFNLELAVFNSLVLVPPSQEKEKKQLLF